MLLFGFTVFTDIFWSLLMLGPATTSLHAGSYATVVASFAAGILGLWTVSRWLALVITLAQVALFSYIHFFLLVPPKGNLQPGMTELSVLGIVGTLYLLRRVCGQKVNRKASESLPRSPEKALSATY